VQRYEDERYDMCLQQYSSGTFQNLSWMYNWNPFGTTPDKHDFQQEIDNGYQHEHLRLVFKQSVDVDTQMEIYMLPSDINIEQAINDVEENAQRNAEFEGVVHEEYSAGSNQGWSYSKFRVPAGTIPEELHMGGGGTDYWTPEELNVPYRVLIFENGEMTANILLEQEAMLYEE